MELSEFQKEYHWMYGLGEYFNHKGPDYEKRWDNIHKALFQNNWYRKRDILMELIAMDNSNPTHVKSWINLLAHEHLPEIQIKPQLVVTLMRKLMKEDPMLVSMARFINHFTSEDGDAAHLPDLNDFLSKGQVQSKLWMADALKDIFDEDVGNVVFYGGWYNFFAHFLFEHFNVDNCYSLDLNMETVEASKKLYQHEHSKGKFHPYHTDVSKVVWKNDMMCFNDLAPKEEKDKAKAEEKEEKDKADLLGYTIVDGISVLSTHLQETLKSNFDKIVSRQSVKQLLENLKKNYPAVVNDIDAEALPLGTIEKVLQNLLREFIPIKDLVQILESLIDYSKVTKNIDYVFNMACNMGGMGFIENNKAECMQSVLINTNLLISCKEDKVKKYFFSSSACAYNKTKQQEVFIEGLKEEDAYPADPEDGYGWEKLFSERMCRHFMEDYGIEVRVARYHNIYGPYGTYDGGREKAPAALCRKIINAKLNSKDTIDVWGDGNQTRSFMYIDDCIIGTKKLFLSDSSDVYNIGSEEQVSINQMISIIEEKHPIINILILSEIFYINTISFNLRFVSFFVNNFRSV